jgi:hypothetical protein
LKTTKNIQKILAISTIMLLTATILLAVQPVQADVETIGAPDLQDWSTTIPEGVTPSIQIATRSYISLSPNPIGVGQSLLVNLWLEPPSQYNRYFSGFSVEITKPDGTTDSVGPLNSYQGDATAWFTYNVDQAGDWEFKFKFAGNYFPAGVYFNGKVYNNTAEIGPYTATMFGAPIFLDSAYYKSSESPVVKVTVLNETVASYQGAPLPTDYWTRPININNREWWEIGGQYPFAGQGGGPGYPENTNAFASNYKFTPYVEAPNTAHIAWKRQGAFAGIAGGQYGYRSVGPGESAYAGTPAIIFQGRAYQTVSKAINGVAQNVLQCYDIRTGEIYWEQVGIAQAPTAVTLNQIASAVPGAGATGSGQGTFSLLHISSRLVKYNAWNGAVQLNISLPVTSGTYYNDPFVLSVQNIGNTTNPNYRLINWTTAGSDTDFSKRVMSNVSYPFSSLGTCDFESMVAVSTGSIIPAGAGTAQGQFIMGASLTTGALLWNVTTDHIFYSTSTAVADQGKYTVRMLDGVWIGWDLKTGQQLWTTEKLPYPWGDFGAYTIASYGGVFYDFSYAGIYAFSWTDGSIAWNFSTPGIPFESPWYPNGGWFSNSPQIADGKLYYANGEHSPTQPLARGWRLWCFDALTGEVQWNITGGGSAGAVADGYLTYDNRYDGYMYVFGKGKSATTISLPQTGIVAGQKAIISGTVMDLSPAQPNTPCVSKDTMGPWMEYLHMQTAMPSGTGVPVSIDAVDPNGNPVHIATVTSDLSGTYAYTWEPELTGEYTITATFVGDDSYGSSWAETHAVVVEATETPPTATAPNFDAVNNTVTTTVIAGVVAIIIAVALATVLILRKK